MTNGSSLPLSIVHFIKFINLVLWSECFLWIIQYIDLLKLLQGIDRFLLWVVLLEQNLLSILSAKKCKNVLSVEPYLPGIIIKLSTKNGLILIDLVDYNGQLCSEGLSKYCILIVLPSGRSLWKMREAPDSADHSSPDKGINMAHSIDISPIKQSMK